MDDVGPILVHQTQPVPENEQPLAENDAESFFNLGMMNLKKNDGMKAVENFEKARRLGHFSALEEIKTIDISKYITIGSTGCHYGKRVGGMRFATSGAEQAEFAVQSGCWLLVDRIWNRYPMLDWGNNLFLVACQKKHMNLIRHWHIDQIEYYGWIYGFETALLNRDVELVEWFVSQAAFQHPDMQQSLKDRGYSQNVVRRWLNEGIASLINP